MSFQPRKYQEKALANFLEWLPSPEPLATITLMVGTGKTATASLCVSKINHKVLWVAHREELVDQAYQALSYFSPHKKITIEMAAYKADSESDIVVGTVQTISRGRKHFNFNPELIIIDEYHHYSENNVQYDSLLKKWPQAKVLGLSATPWRSNGEELPLGKVLMTMDIGTAVHKGYLVPPIPETIFTSTSLANVGTRMGDFATKELVQVINTDSRNKLIVSKTLDLIHNHKRQGMIFAADINHAKTLFSLLKDHCRAAEIYGETDKNVRKDIIQKLRQQEIDVLINLSVLLEGFDAPHLSFVVMARPTRLLSLYIQAIGRGLRTSPNKSDCIIVDICDKIKVKQTRVTFQDMAQHGDLYGER